MLELQVFLQIVDVASANQYQFATSTVCKNIVEKFI